VKRRPALLRGDQRGVGLYRKADHEVTVVFVEFKFADAAVPIPTRDGFAGPKLTDCDSL